MIVNFASALADERDYLYEALTDFRPDGKRERYASWLAANGDVARAETVRATIVAYNELDLKLLSNPADQL